MKQAITTKYLPYTDTKPGRVKAITSSGISITLPYDHERSADGNHTWAAKALVERMGWGGVWVAGGLGRGNCYVALPKTLVIGPEASPAQLGLENVDWFRV